MSAQRLEQGGEIDRSRALRFRFDGQEFSGFAGDTVASALLADGVQILGRSFKYHRPRGLLGAGWEEPNALLDLRHGSRHDPNARITREVLEEGMELRSVHASGSAAHDRLAFLDRFARFIPAAFYYKTFMWPHWRLFEGAIRRMAGIGRLDPRARAHADSPLHLRADVCVIGAGPAGLAAAQAAQARGFRVVLADERSLPGGSLLWRETRIAGVPGAQWAAEAARSLVAGGATVLQNTSAVGLYDHNAITLLQREAGSERLLLVRAREIVLATGAIERPLLFAHNDRPGVMLADAVLEYLRRYAVRAGERVVVATANDAAWETAFALQAAGARCVGVDARTAPPLAQAAQQAGIELRSGARVAEALGAPVVSGVRLDSGERIACDLVAVGGGWNPLINLWCHSRGRPRWHAELGCYLPGDAQPGLRVAGSANGGGGAGHHGMQRILLGRIGSAGSLAGGQRTRVGRPAARRDREGSGTRDPREFPHRRAPEALHHARHGERPGPHLERERPCGSGRPHGTQHRRRWHHHFPSSLCACADGGGRRA